MDLPVADVGVEAAEERQPAARAHRRDDAALRQRRGQPDGLEQHRLSAGVGTADEEGALRRHELEVERNDRIRAGQQQRMAAVHDRERRPGRRPPRAPRLRPPRHSARGRPGRPRRRTSRPASRSDGSSGRSRSVSSRSTRSVSRSSSTSASRSALPSSIASDGSMKRVPALPDLVVDDARRAGSASRGEPESRSGPPRTVTPASAGAALASSPRSSDSSFRRSRWRAACTSRRAAASRGLAVSSSAPSGSTDCSSRRSMRACRAAGDRSAAASGARRRPRAGDRRAPARGATSTRCRAGQLHSLEHAALDPQPAERAGRHRESARPAAHRPGGTAPPPRPPARAPRAIHAGSSVGRRARTRAAPSGPDGMRGHELDHRRELDGLERVGTCSGRQRRRGAALRVGRHPVRRERFRPATSARLQLLAHDLVDHLAVGPPLELRQHLAHHLADVLRAAGDRARARRPGSPPGPPREAGTPPAP